MMEFSFRYILLLLFFAVGFAQAETLTVGAGKEFPTITSAILEARTGDTIQVYSGTYNENIRLEKSLSLEGIEKPRIRGNGQGSVITVDADDCVISGFVIEHSGGDLTVEDSGILLRSKGNRVEQNELRDILYGIYLLRAPENIIRANIITGRAELESGERGAGLHLWNSGGNILEDNTVTFARDGIYVQNSSNNTMRRNHVSDLRYGLHFMSSDDNTFEENIFHDNIAGAAIMYSRRITLRKNQFLHNRGFSSFGILFQDCENCLAEENLIFNNATGIFLEGTRDSFFRKNSILQNDVALQIFSSSEQNTFSENNFIDNLSPLMIVGNSTNAKWQSDVGNYWSDYGGYDLDGDGVGDIPQKIQNVFEYLEGNFPRMRIYLNSPAAQAIVVAEKSFPILESSKEFDRKPLMRPVPSDLTIAEPAGSAKGKWLTVVFSVAILFASGFLLTRKLNK